jgi:hypothetical protein
MDQAWPQDVKDDNYDDDISYYKRHRERPARKFALSLVNNYKEGLSKINKDFLENALRIDSKWGKKYKVKINEDLWLRETGGIMDRNLAYSLGIKESSSNPREVSPKGATGYWQIMKPTWGSFMDTVKYPFEKHAKNFKMNEKAAVKNFGAVIKYLEKRIPNWEDLELKDKRELVLASHNWGQGNVKNVGGDLTLVPRETKDLIGKTLTYYDYQNKQDEHKEYLKNREQAYRISEGMESMRSLKTKPLIFN